MNEDEHQYFLTCIYCGKPNVHPERVHRYCTNDFCVKDANSMVFPKYQTTAIIDNVAEIMEKNSILNESLQNALQTIEEQHQQISQYKTTIAEVYSKDKSARHYEIDVARWDLIRLLIAHHQQLHNAISLKELNPAKELDWLEQAYSILTHNLSKYGIEPIGKQGDEIIVDHKYHDSYSPPGAPAKIIRTGYYSSKSDYVIIKAVTVGDQDVYPWTKNNDTL